MIQLTPLTSSESLLSGEGLSAGASAVDLRRSGRVEHWAASDLAAARVQGGMVAAKYGQLGAALRAATQEVPKFIDTDSPRAVVGALLESWSAGGERYARTGAGYAEAEGRLANQETSNWVASHAARGSPDSVAAASLLAAGARLQEFADGRAGLELFVLVEIRSRAPGEGQSVTLLHPSGMASFDSWVMDRAREVGQSFSVDGGPGETSERSVWRFDGVITFRRQLKKLDGRAAIGLAAMAALSALSSVGHEYQPDKNNPEEMMGPPRPLGPRMPAFTGRFDEKTGALDMVDLTNPTYSCRVSLLEAD